MLIFGNDKHARGCFREIMGEQTKIRAAAYLSIGGNTYPRPDTGSTEPYFISNFSIGQKEKYNVVQCFGDRNYTYAFGHDPTASMAEITFTMFLTDPSGTEFGNSLALLTRSYERSRLSQYPAYAFVTVGSATYKGFIVGMTSATQDQEHNLQSMTFLMLLVEAQKGY